MAKYDKATSDATVATARKLMESFGQDMDAFWSLVDPEVEMELPFAGTIGLPNRLKGEQAFEMFRTASGTFDVKFNSIEVTPLADPHRVLVEYRGYGEPGGIVYDQRYVGVHEYRDGKLVYYKEYFDTAIVRDSLGPFLPPAG